MAGATLSHSVWQDPGLRRMCSPEAQIIKKQIDGAEIRSVIGRPGEFETVVDLGGIAQRISTQVLKKIRPDLVCY